MADSLQNKFLETIIGLSSELEGTFFLANAKVRRYPIIYCSEEFSEETGYPRYEVTQYDVYFEFLHGRQTSTAAVKSYADAVGRAKKTQVEMVLYTKHERKNWYLVSVFPVKRDCDGIIGFFLVLFNNITHLKPVVHDSPRRIWKRAVRKILNKPSLEKIREDISKSKKKKSKKLDMYTIRQRSANLFVPDYGGEIFELAGFFIITHFSYPKILWDTTIVFLIIYTAIAMPYLTAFDLHDHTLGGVDVFIDFIFILDIVLNFFTTYIDSKGDVVSLPKKIRTNYIKGWFFIDVLSSVPYLIFFAVVKLMEEDIRSMKGFIIIKVLRLLRITKIKRKVERYMQLSSVILAVWLSAFFMFSHWLACIWYAIAVYIDHPYHTKHGWIYLYSQVSNKPYQFDNYTNIVYGTGPDNPELYVSSLYYTLSSLTTCGFGNIAPNTSCEKIFGCITMLIGCLFYAFIFGQVTNIITQMQRNSNEFKDRLDDIKRFNDIYKVPPKIAKRLEHYFRSTWATTKGTDEEEILRICPRDLQSDLCLHIHSRIFASNKGFQKLSTSALRLISRYLCTIRTATGDKVVFAGEFVDMIYFVGSGALEVKQGESVMGLIGPGDAFGQRLGYVEECGKSLFDVQATSFGTIHCISREHLKEALALFPQEYEQIRYSLVLSIDITRRIKFRRKELSPPADQKLSGKSKEYRITNQKVDVIEKTIPIQVDKSVTDDKDQTEVEWSHDTKSEELFLSGMSELKGELRRETERMNAKMGLVEAQMRLVLKLLKKQNRIEVDPEIGTQLNELLDDDVKERTFVETEWQLADASGWKKYRNKRTNKTDIPLKDIVRW